MIKIKLKKLTFKHCLAFQDLEIDSIDFNLVSAFLLAEHLCEYSDFLELKEQISRLSLKDYSLFFNQLIVRLKVCKSFSKDQIYEIIFHLNGKNFNNYTAFLDIPINEINMMIQVFNRNQKNNF